MVAAAERTVCRQRSTPLRAMLAHLPLLCAAAAVALVPRDHVPSSNHATSDLSRAQALGSCLSTAAAALVLSPHDALALNPMTDTKRRGSSAYVDEGPAYLTEPTAEFKKAEAARAAFRQRQAVYRKQWDSKFAEFVDAKNDDQLVVALTGLTKMVAVERGLPSGLRLTDMITQCRRVKVNTLSHQIRIAITALTQAKASQLGGWGTPVEIEYLSALLVLPCSDKVLLQTLCAK